MKSVDDWFNDGMADIELSWHADYQSELVGDLESAIADFDQALALKRDHVEALIQKGLALARLGRHDEAETTFGQAIQLKRGAPEPWLQRSKSLANLGRHEEALTACDEVLLRRPEDADAWFRRAEMLDALGRDTDALAAWDEVLRQPACRTINFHSRMVQVLTFDVRRLKARLSRAGALARLGRRAEAVVAYREALEEGEPEQVLHGALSVVFHEALRSLEAARAAYHEHMQRKANDAGTWRRAGHAFLCAGRMQESLEAYETMIRLAPDNADAWWGKAEALVQAGRRDESVAAYRQAIRLRPDFLAASARLRVVLEEIDASKRTRDAGRGKWKVMGRDTFAREDYFVGTFVTEEEARECLREREAAVQTTQDEALRDSYWIVPPGSG